MLLRLNSSTFSDANHRIIRRPLPLNLSPLFTLPPSFSRSSRHPSLGIWVTRKKYVARNSSLVPFFFFFLFFLSLVRGEATATSRESLKTQQLDNSLVFYNRSSLLLSIINSPLLLLIIHYPSSVIRVQLGDAISACPSIFPRLGKG